jgi:hypothetical protein
MILSTTPHITHHSQPQHVTNPNQNLLHPRWRHPSLRQPLHPDPRLHPRPARPIPPPDKLHPKHRQPRRPRGDLSFPPNPMPWQLRHRLLPQMPRPGPWRTHLRVHPCQRNRHVRSVRGAHRRRKGDRNSSGGVETEAEALADIQQPLLFFIPVFLNRRHLLPRCNETRHNLLR